MTDGQIRKAMIRESIADYSGPCPCPYNEARDGRSCGRRSAYSRPGGYAPLCYSRDITKAMIAEYRQTHGIPEPEQSKVSSSSTGSSRKSGGGHASRSSQQGKGRRQELIALYRELRDFKNTPLFAEVGFAVCCQYNGWLRRVEALRGTPGQEWLLQLGHEYVSTQGRDNADTRDDAKEFRAAVGLRGEPQAQAREEEDYDSAASSAYDEEQPDDVPSSDDGE